MDDDKIRNTIKATTQFYRTKPNPLQLRQTYRTPFPACNVRRRNEAVATDTVYSSTPAINNGANLAQIYVGRDSLVKDMNSIKTKGIYLYSQREYQ